jgi:hypothetical protein
MKLTKLWIFLCGSTLLTGCSLFEAPALETPKPAVIPDGRALIEKSLDQFFRSPQGTFKITADLKMVSPATQDAIALALNGQFDHQTQSTRAQGTLSLDLPTESESIANTEHTRGIANIDTVGTNNQILLRLISTQFSGPNSEDLNTNVTPLNNIWFTIPASNTYWPPQKLLTAFFANNDTNWKNYSQYLQIKDVALVQMADEKAYQIDFDLNTSQLLTYLDLPLTIEQMDPSTRASYKQLIPLLQTNSTIFISANTGSIKSLLGTVTLQGQLNSATSININYKLELQEQNLNSPIIIPAPEQVIDSQNLIKLLSSGQ